MLDPDHVNKAGNTAWNLAQDRKVLPERFLEEFGALLEAYRHPRRMSDFRDPTAFLGDGQVELGAALNKGNFADEGGVFVDALE